MSGKENKNISGCPRLCSIPRRSVASPFSSTSKKAASSGVRLPSPARRSIAVPLIPNSPSAPCIPYLRRSIVNPTNNVLKEDQNIPKIYKCNIKPEAVNPDKILIVKSLNKKINSVPRKINQPLKPEPYIVKKIVKTAEPSLESKPEKLIFHDPQVEKKKVELSCPVNSNT